MSKKRRSRWVEARRGRGLVLGGMVLLLVVGISGCTQTPPGPAGTPTPAASVHSPATPEPPPEVTEAGVIRTAHYTLTLPDSWTGHYVVHQDREWGVDRVSFYERRNYEAAEGGYLFSIHVARTGSEEAYGLQEADCWVWDSFSGADGVDYDILIGTPHDVQFALDAAQPYLSMSEQLEEVLSTLRLHGEE